MNRGFSLVELLVVIGVITLMTALIVPNYRFGDKSLALARTSSKLAQDLRRVQNLAISAQKFSGAVPAGYGVYFNLSQPAQYILFADLDANKIYSGASEKVETIAMEKQMRISSLSPVSGSSLNIVFNPPDPSVFVTPDAATARITIEAIGTTQQKAIQVNKVGLISVE